ncbi:alpha-galactosidase [Thorsellia kenyensis]|uniref:Alpha-galactosidase n=1 Tax=Thorsellia kenyensis TaxID=1549888 RepID=A0ABV6CDA1_9GAMM
MTTFNQLIKTNIKESAAKVIHLKSSNLSLLILCERMPTLIYWGKRIKNLNSSCIELPHDEERNTLNDEVSLVLNMLAALSKPVPQGGLDDFIPLSLCPESASGLFSSPGVEGHKEGKHWAPLFNLIQCEVSSHKDVEKLQCILIDNICELELTIELKLHTKEDIVEKNLSLKNLSQSPYTLNKLAHTLPFFDEESVLTSFHGRWCQEMQKLVQPIERKSIIQENRRGKTSLEYFPGVIISKRETNEFHGDAIGFHLAWSGNHQFNVHVETDAKRFVQANELLMPGEIILQNNDTYHVPTLYASYSQQGFNGMSQNFHAFIRNNLVKFAQDLPVRPIHLNTWEGIYFDHDPKYILSMAEKASEVGIERFIIDDGWFIGRSDDKRALGDWYVDKNKYPEGLTPIIEKVHALGMQFGLWVEPEMISKESLLFKNHPEWLLETPGYIQPTGRYQYVLNLQLEDCFDYVFERLDTLLSEYPINYLKWDMNRDLVQASHNFTAAYSKQTHQVYRLIDKLKKKHPNVEIESCASGGGRMDYEILKRTQRFWASDCNDAFERQSIQRNLSYFFPPEILGTHIGASISHSTYRQHTVNFRAITALFGHMGIEFDPLKTPSSELDELTHYLTLHKELRPLLHKGKAFRLDSIDKSQIIHAVSDDTQTIISIAQMAMPSFSTPPVVKLPFLEENSRYKIECLDIPANCGHLMKKWPEWLKHLLPSMGTYDFKSHTSIQMAKQIHSPIWLNGEMIANIGLALPILDPQTAMLLKLTKQ